MEEKENNVIEIRPVSKWKRFLTFLADYFISFIIAFTLFNLAIFPLAKIVFSTQDKSEHATALEKQAVSLLIEDGFLYSAREGSNFEDDVNYTFKVFLSYYAFDEETPDSAHLQYGHKLENEVVYHYYQNVIKDEAQYVTDFKEVNQADDMFNIGEDFASIALKSDYKNILANELLEVTDEEKYSVAMTNFRDHVFAKLFYLHVYNHIIENDYVKGDVSFNKCLTDARDIMRNLQWVATGSVLFTVLLTWGIVYMAYPLINKDCKTIANSAMHIAKLHYKSLGPITKSSVLIQSFYQFIFMLSFALVLPVLYFGVSYSFNLPLLFVLSVISLGLIIISGLFIFFNEHNRSGSDILTNIVLLPDSEIDNMYKVDINDGK